LPLQRAISVFFTYIVMKGRNKPQPHSLTITLECDHKAEAVTAWVSETVTEASDHLEIEPATLPITSEDGVAEILRWVGSEFGFDIETASVKKEAVKWVTLHLKGRTSNDKD
jgi:hypothetical protein